MTRRSLRARFWLVSLLSVALAVLLAGFGLLTLFERHVERRIGADMVSELNRLAAGIVVGAQGAPVLEPEPLDPSLGQPLSGHYWQIDAPGQPGILRSRSLWDAVIDLPGDVIGPGQVHAHRLAGPAGQLLMVRERQIQLNLDGQTRVLRLVVARDRAELNAARKAFAADLWPYLAVICLVLLVATLIQIQIGLAPLESVRRAVESVRSGAANRLADEFPTEVMPLVAEVNALLDARDQALERARAWTADLAHGLKTPLSALAADAQRLRERGQPDLAADLEQLATAMRRRVERELVRARVRSGASAHQARADVAAVISKLLRTLQRTPDGERLCWELDAPESPPAAIMPDDLFELLGNLLENAAKWAKSRVWILVRQGDGWVQLQVRDDGLGAPAAQWANLGQRGLRLDQRKEGQGLGLAIVQDVLDGYGGELQFGAAAEGGLQVDVRLPAVR